MRGRGVSLPPILLLGYAALLGWNGRDLCRWSLARRGFAQSHVLAGADADAAYERLLARDSLLGAAEFS